MKIEWRRGRLEDLDHILSDELLKPGLKENILALWSETDMHLLSRTMIADGQVVAVVGISMYWDGVASAWAFVDPKARGCAKSLVRGIRNWRDWAVMHFKLRRLQASCDVGNPAYSRTLEVAGFVKEGVMRRYGFGGEDHVLYAFVPEHA